MIAVLAGIATRMGGRMLIGKLGKKLVVGKVRAKLSRKLVSKPNVSQGIRKLKDIYMSRKGIQPVTESERVIHIGTTQTPKPMISERKTPLKSVEHKIIPTRKSDRRIDKKVSQVKSEKVINVKTEPMIRQSVSKVIQNVRNQYRNSQNYNTIQNTTNQIDQTKSSTEIRNINRQQNISKRETRINREIKNIRNEMKKVVVKKIIESKVGKEIVKQVLPSQVKKSMEKKIKKVLPKQSTKQQNRQTRTKQRQPVEQVINKDSSVEILKAMAQANKSTAELNKNQQNLQQIVTKQNQEILQEIQNLSREIKNLKNEKQTTQAPFQNMGFGSSGSGNIGVR